MPSPGEPQHRPHFLTNHPHKPALVSRCLCVAYLHTYISLCTSRYMMRLSYLDRFVSSILTDARIHLGAGTLQAPAAAAGSGAGRALGRPPFGIQPQLRMVI